MASAQHAPCEPAGCSTWVDDVLESAGVELAPEDRSDCCAKDARQAAAARQLLGVLSAADPARVALSLRAGVLGQAPPPLPREPLAASDESSFDSSSEGEAGGGDAQSGAALDALRALRLSQLRRAAQQAEEQRIGAGELAELGDAAACAAARAARRAVVHVPLAGLEASDRCDELLCQLARKHPATRFLRVPAAAGASATALLLRLPSLAPPLLGVLRRGALQALAPGYSLFGGAAAFDERRLTRWLADARALAEGGESSEEEAEEREEGRSGAPGNPCPSCGRTYPHEHVRALKARGIAAGDSEDEE